MFCIEALVIAGRPILITLPLTVLSVGFMITESYLNPIEFLVPGLIKGDCHWDKHSIDLIPDGSRRGAWTGSLILLEMGSGR